MVMSDEQAKKKHKEFNDRVKAKLEEVKGGGKIEGNGDLFSKLRQAATQIRNTQGRVSAS